MLNPDPEKFYTLPEAFDVLGCKRFADKWKGSELTSRALPPPKDTFLALENADAGLEPEIAKAATNQRAYRKEYKARGRRDETEHELRTRFHGGRVPTTLLNKHDGRSIDVPHTHWLADKFMVDFASGQAEWTDFEGSQQVTYQGMMLIDRHTFDRVFTIANQFTKGAENKCHEWAHGLAHGNQVWRKGDFLKQAIERFPGLSKKGAMRVWDDEVPDDWKLAGRKS